MTDETYPVEDWLLNLPMYAPVEIGKDVDYAVQAVLNFAGTMDAFCPECQQGATFIAAISDQTERLLQEAQRQVALRRLTGVSGSSTRRVWHIPTFLKSIVCTRAEHIVHFHFVMNGGAIIKIGQYPSLADMATGDTSQFEKALGKSRLHELNKAIGLAAHGVGIGSYVYLRRVFESLIDDAQARARLAQDWKDDEYQKGKMKEKISLLRNFLPQFIVEHPQLYGILSLGVHELTEEECLKNFEVLKAGILVIAEERMHEIQREKRYREASQALASVSQGIKAS